ncbi:hypothetical protein Bcop_0332 [Bacteroides coprosuis DSM 18011]|uniref:DUF2851 domain-containing protein n=1 Tax=Bacteroides coprosuis DSM 18011 TaxID=679937 RepID=F3ZQH3_9BACE|nr:DUF2851 family protein [Bacteroides coprosuis]EGJ70551.1 hypothetical protein Bcop_0332 [Bacteroides coprosuis DSM 18011]
MEELLYYVWQHRLFTLGHLETIDHIPVEVIDTGLRNINSGPDFFNAKLKIGNTLWVGNVEMHCSSSDWYRHGHNKDKGYDSVILHVVEKYDEEVFRTSGERIPQMVLVYSSRIKSKFQTLKQIDYQPKCFETVQKLDSFTIHSWLSALQIERLEVKQTRILELFETKKYNWRDILFITLSRNFGFGLNGDIFERWAKKLPYRSLDKHRDSLLQLESMFFGLAGLLAKDSSDNYFLRLQEEFYFLKTKFCLEDEAYPWQLSKIRPGSFPHVRIAQLAWFYHKGEEFSNKLLETSNLDQVYELLYVETSEYWDTHFIFEKESVLRHKHLGKKSMDLLVINTIVPFLYAYGKHKGDDLIMENALNLLNQIKPENNHIIRLWEQANINAESAADSQALIQLQREYCDKKKCLYCRFGFYHLSDKKGSL